MKNEEYVFPQYMPGEELKEIRKSLNMTQKQFALFTGVSTPTIERLERQDKASGPIVILAEILRRNRGLPDKMTLPEKSGNIRLKYSYKSMLCTVIDVNVPQRNVQIKNYIDNPMFRAFGVNTEPTYEDYEAFLESRCFPRERDKIKLELDRLGIPFYEPLLIIEKTKGRMSEDDFSITIER